jgi:hypothetical protein
VRILLAGGSGLLGRALGARLGRDGHTVRVLTRRPRPGMPDDVPWTPDGSAGAWASEVGEADALVNLAGEGIADRRWSAQRKEALRASRLLATRSLVEAVRRAARPPRVFVSGSAVGYYGPRGDEILTERDDPGSDFLARLAAEWEREAAAAPASVRVAVVRTGLVLDPAGGALRKMLLPFRLGLGGRVGSGRQYMPWIHIDDWVRLIAWILASEGARGAFNATAPAPVTNAAFTRALGRALSRPAVIPVPGFAVRVLLGELAGALLTGQRAVPARALEMGFAFRFTEIEPALADLLID